VSGGIPSRGLLNAANIAPVLQEKIGREIEAHSIMPFLDGEVSGSGTLVTIDGVHGILTAGHVVRNWHDAKDEHPKRLGLVPYRGASTLVEEPLQHFGSFVTEADHSDALGPDFAFVRIPSPSGFLSTLLAKKSFFDLSGSSVRNRIVAITGNTPLALCGIVAEKTERAGRNIILKSVRDLRHGTRAVRTGRI
jgi:hypothetical protein